MNKIQTQSRKGNLLLSLLRIDIVIKKPHKSTFLGVSHAKLVYCGVTMIKTQDFGDFWPILRVLSNLMSD